MKNVILTAFSILILGSISLYPKNVSATDAPPTIHHKYTGLGLCVFNGTGCKLIYSDSHN